MDQPRTEPLPPQVPRLSIIHLMGWIACTAVYLVTVREFARFAFFNNSNGDSLLSGNSPFDDGLIRVADVYLLIQSPMAGAALGGLALWIIWPQLGIAFSDDPGACLLGALGAEVVLQFAIFWTAALALQVSAGDASTWLMLCAFLLRIPIYMFAFSRVDASEWWLWFWIALTFNVVIVCLTPFLAIWLLALAIYDLVRKARRSWLHWTGMLVGFCYLATGGLGFPGNLLLAYLIAG